MRTVVSVTHSCCPMDKLMNSMKRYSAVYKILVIGDSGVGKTALLMRLCEERYESITKYTIGKPHAMPCAVFSFLVWPH